MTGYSIAAGEETFPRHLCASDMQLASGLLRLGFFVPDKTEQITRLRITTTGTAASGGTLLRFGVWMAMPNGDLRPLANTANDTAIMGSTNTEYTKSWSQKWTKVKGQKYAFGALFVGTTGPRVPAAAVGSAPAAFRLETRLAAVISGQADLPSGVISNASLGGTNAVPFAELLP